MDLVDDHLPIHPPIATLDIHGVEADPELVVTPLIPLETQPHPGWGIWPDICDDDRVAYMEQRIADRQPFTKTMWPGGDTSEVFITFPNAAVGLKTKKRSTHSRKTGGKNKKLRDAIGIRASARKQRRISTYFSRWSLESIWGISATVQEVHKQMRRRKRHSSCKQSSFQSLLQSSKTSNKTSDMSDKGCQTDPSWMVHDSADNNPPEPQIDQDKQPVPSSSVSEKNKETNIDPDGTPIVSQYAAHHFLQKEIPAMQPVHGTTVHTASIQDSTVHITPIHNSIVQTPSPPAATAFVLYDTSALNL
ncbi:DUF1985 domain-containing protein [Raphanus sativus]|nr:DUF1985 domain-containing protein [Raphanus sativus]